MRLRQQKCLVDLPISSELFEGLSQQSPGRVGCLTTNECSVDARVKKRHDSNKNTKQNHNGPLELQRCDRPIADRGRCLGGVLRQMWPTSRSTPDLLPSHSRRHRARISKKGRARRRCLLKTPQMQLHKYSASGHRRLLACVRWSSSCHYSGDASKNSFQTRLSGERLFRQPESWKNEIATTLQKDAVRPRVRESGARVWWSCITTARQLAAHAQALCEWPCGIDASAVAGSRLPNFFCLA